MIMELLHKLAGVEWCGSTNTNRKHGGRINCTFRFKPWTQYDNSFFLPCICTIRLGCISMQLYFFHTRKDIFIKLDIWQLKLCVSTLMDGSKQSKTTTKMILRWRQNDFELSATLNHQNRSKYVPPWMHKSDNSSLFIWYWKQMYFTRLRVFKNRI